MTYRRDIDGLRAVAVLAVVLFHFGLPGITGGFLGVDVFFCISGYLIGGIIIDETGSGRFSYTRFYTRRIKRLFPAFFAMAVVTLPFAWWLMLPEPDFLRYGKSLVAATAYVPNLLFYRELHGYFGGDAQTMPLLHTWSLGVEEQFYVFFPLLMRIVLRVSGRFEARHGAALTIVALAGSGALSLAYAQHRLGFDPVSAFYWLPPRAWELLLGAFVALPAIRELRATAGAGRALALLALLAVLVPMFVYSEATPFPGLAAVPPCLGTTYLLWWGRQQSTGFPGNLLGATPPVFIGQISYSLYLWHWPVYVLLAYHFSGELSWPLRAGALLFVLVASYLSWRFIEQPVRGGKAAPGSVFGAAALGSLLVIGIGAWIWEGAGLPQRLSGDTRLIAAAARDFIRDDASCATEKNDAIPGLGHCRVGDAAAAPQFLVWGDSHARAVRPGVDRLAHETGSAGLVVWAPGCLPAFGALAHESYGGEKGDTACSAQNLRLRQWLAQRPEGLRTVLLVGRWAFHASGHGVGIDARSTIRLTRADGSAAPQAQIVAELLGDTVRWLRGEGYEVYLLEQLPEFPDFSAGRLFQLVRGGQADLQGALARIGSVSRGEVESRQQEANAMLAAIANGGAATVLPTHAQLCDAARCSVWTDAGQGYLDNNHPTVTEALRLRRVFAPLMQR